MFAWIKKHYKLWIVLLDVLIAPGIFLCRWLTDTMLSTDNPCVWTLFGGQCITCGGTHFVNDLANFRIFAALQDNLFLFVLTVFLLLTLVFLNLWLVFGIPFFKKVLKKMYNIPSLIIWLSVMVLFVIVRNVPAVFRICQALLQML